jgi:cation-transporting P-type ATPase 13A2
LVPGDIIEIPNGKIMPCDLVLLNGKIPLSRLTLTGICIMNESMLTGESIPVIKQAMAAIDKEFDPLTDQKHIVFSGTKCLETRRVGNGQTPVLGVVIQTGYSTMKGKLVRSLIYPKPELFRFYQDAITFIGFMFLIAMICKKKKKSNS